MSTKTSTIQGTAWTLTERVSVQLIQFVIGIILARKLAPEAYGIVGMLGIFLGIAQICLDCGFGNALIRKKDKTDVDYSTIFIFNLGISLLLYAALYIGAPLIASFYKIPELTGITRVISLTIILNALSLVHTAKLTYELNFKLQSVTAIIAVIISGIVGIWMAYHEYGVWALVGQSICMSLLRTAILWVASRWKPLLCFSVSSFKEMFAYGSRLLASGLIHTIYTNLYTIIVGKFFDATSTGYYNRANTYGLMPNNICDQVVNKVFFPVLSRQQDDISALIGTYKKMIKTLMYVYVPFLIGMAALSSQLLEVLIGPKWLPCAPLLSILCIGYAIAPLTSVNLNLLFVKGRSDLTLRLDIIKKIIGTIILFASLPFGLWWMCFGKAIYEVVAFSLNSHYTKKFFGYGAFAQIKDILPTFIMSASMYALIAFILRFFHNPWTELFVGFGTGVAFYFIISLLTGNESLKDIFGIVSDIKKKKDTTL